MIFCQCLPVPSDNTDILECAWMLFVNSEWPWGQNVQLIHCRNCIQFPIGNFLLSEVTLKTFACTLRRLLWQSSLNSKKNPPWNTSYWCNVGIILFLESYLWSVFVLPLDINSTVESWILFVVCFCSSSWYINSTVVCWILFVVHLLPFLLWKAPHIKLV